MSICFTCVGGGGSKGGGGGGSGGPLDTYGLRGRVATVWSWESGGRICQGAYGGGGVQCRGAGVGGHGRSGGWEQRGAGNAVRVGGTRTVGEGDIIGLGRSADRGGSVGGTVEGNENGSEDHDLLVISDGRRRVVRVRRLRGVPQGWWGTPVV